MKRRLATFSVPMWAILVALAILPVTTQAGYTNYLAPGSTCQGADNAQASLAAQEKSMRCLINYARSKRGIAKLRANGKLRRSADFKSYAIRRCNDFSHEACGSSFTGTFRRAGYVPRASTWSVGENIAWWAPAGHATPRKIMNAWLNSTGHRENIFTGKWREQGVSAVRAASFQGNSNAVIWTSQFGRRG